MSAACEHTWLIQPAASGTIMSRYKCTLCGCWGFWVWKKGKKREVKMYVENGMPRMEPRPEWFYEPPWTNEIPKKPAREDEPRPLRSDRWVDPG